MTLRGIGFVILLSACSQGTVVVYSGHAIVTGESHRAAEWRFPEMASSYGQAKPGKLSLEEAALLEDIRNNGGHMPCELDSVLVVAARRYADYLSTQDTLSTETELDWLRFVLWSSGSYDYSVEPVVFSLDARGLSGLHEALSRDVEHWTHCGIGLASGGVRGVWIGTRRRIRLTPFPVAPASHSMLTLRGMLREPLREVSGFLEFPDERIVRLAGVVQGNALTIHLPLAEPGRYVLELQVTDASGPETTLLVPLYVDIPVDSRPRIRPMIEDSDVSPTTLLADVVNRVRNRQGLRPLQRDSRLDQVAQNHCLDMVRNDSFGHYSPRTGFLEDRLRAAGLRPLRSGENIARSTSVMRVHHNLMESPSHRIKILMPEFTHLGLGVVMDGDAVVVTQIFAGW